MTKRSVQFVLFSEARAAVIAHFANLVTPTAIAEHIATGASLGPNVNTFSRDSVVQHYGKHCAAAVLGTNYLVLVQDDGDPMKVWPVVYKEGVIPPPLRLFEAIVKKGIALLDAKGPKDWRKKIDLDTLDLSDADLCIVGQVYGGESAYTSGLRDLFDGSVIERTVCEHGFNANASYHLVALPTEVTDADEDDDEDCDGYSLLTEEWVRQLAAE